MCLASLFSFVTSPPLHSSHLSAMKISFSFHVFPTYFIPSSLFTYLLQYRFFVDFQLCLSAPPLSAGECPWQNLQVPAELPAPGSLSLPLLLLLTMPAYFFNITDTHTDKLIFSLLLRRFWASVPQGCFESKSYLSV